MSKFQYKPESHFFVDHTALATPLATTDPNSATDSYGPVKNFETTKYRTTSIVRATVATNPVKVYAICEGHLFIQPQTDDATKVNLILRPSSSSFAPFKIKYFIYRGVQKSDLIDGVNLKAAASGSPDFLTKIWQQYIAFNTAGGLPAPTTFPASKVGYDPDNQPLTAPIGQYFFSNDNPANVFNIPACTIGEYIGNFVGNIGLDIVLDHGDYDLDYEEKLFQFDFAYARKSEQIFDLSTLTNTVKQKRLKEYIHEFIDAAAFWGSHVDSGKIFLANEAAAKPL